MNSPKSKSRRHVRLLGAVSVAAMAIGLLPMHPASAAEVGAADVEDICPAPGQTDAFTDDDDSTFEDRINCAFAYGLVTGYPDGTFRPTNFITRGQAATLLVNYVETADCDVALETDDDDDFTDVAGNVHEENIQKAADNGIVVGYPDNTFRPNQMISRAQFATMAVQATELALGAELDDDGDSDFDDIAGNVHENNIEKAFDNGMLVGTSPGMFSPDDNVTRGQATSIVIGAAGQILFPAGEFCPADPDGPGFETLTVLPAEDQTVECVAGIDDGDDSDNVEITVTGLLSTEMYRLTLVDAGNISTDDDGLTTFVEDADTGLALAGMLDSRIVSVNGSAVEPAQSVGAVMPVNGQITFVIDCGGAEAVVPVAYTDEGGDNTRLNLDDDGRPTEPFGVGGTITFTEPTGPPPIGPNATFTDAPELVEVRPFGTSGDVVDFVFDETVTGAALQDFAGCDPTDALNDTTCEFRAFRLYNLGGDPAFPFEAAIFGNTVRARFLAGEVSSANRAGVAYNAVEDVQGVPSIEGDFALRATTTPVVQNLRFQPQLQTVTNYRLSDVIIDGQQRVLLDFVFSSPTGYTPGDVNADDFSIVGRLSAVYGAAAIEAVSAGAGGTEIVTVRLADDPSQIPQTQLRRGVVEYDLGSLEEVILSASYGGTDGVTVDPDLVAVERRTANTYAFTFDEAVSALAGDLVAGSFCVFDAAGNETCATSVARSALVDDDARVVIATHPGLPASGVGSPSDASVEDGAVRGTDQTQGVNAGFNRPAQQNLVLVLDPAPTAPEAGTTALPDLLRVGRQQNVVTGNYSVSFTFDSNVCGVVGDVAFDLYNADGNQFRVVGAAGPGSTCSTTTVVFSVDQGFSGFDNDQIEAAVTGGVEDADNPTETAPSVTEGKRGISAGL